MAWMASRTVVLLLSSPWAVRVRISAQILLTSHSALAGVGKRHTGGRASSLGGHLSGQSRGEHTGGGHCD